MKFINNLLNNPNFRANGVGLMIGVVEKPARFSVSLEDVNSNTQLILEIKGPRGEYAREALSSKPKAVCLSLCQSFFFLSVNVSL